MPLLLSLEERKDFQEQIDCFFFLDLNISLCPYFVHFPKVYFIKTLVLPDSLWKIEFFVKHILEMFILYPFLEFNKLSSKVSKKI